MGQANLRGHSSTIKILTAGGQKSEPLVRQIVEVVLKFSYNDPGNAHAPSGLQRAGCGRLAECKKRSFRQPGQRDRVTMGEWPDSLARGLAAVSSIVAIDDSPKISLDDQEMSENVKCC